MVKQPAPFYPLPSTSNVQTENNPNTPEPHCWAAKVDLCGNDKSTQPPLTPFPRLHLSNQH